MMQMKQVLGASACVLSLMLGTTLQAGQNPGVSGAGQSEQSSQSGGMSGAMSQQGQTQSGAQGEANALSIDQQMLNQQVKNPQGEKLGTISDAIVDRFGQVQYVLLSPSGSMDVDAKYIAVPWHAFAGVLEGGSWILPIDKQKLAEAPSFSREQASVELIRPETVTVIYGFYGIPESAAGEGQVAQFSELDTNQDGYISKSEAQAGERLSGNFQQADANSDGKIDSAEFSAFEAGGQSGGDQMGGGQSGMKQQTPGGGQPGSMGDQPQY